MLRPNNSQMRSDDEAIEGDDHVATGRHSAVRPGWRKGSTVTRTKFGLGFDPRTRPLFHGLSTRVCRLTRPRVATPAKDGAVGVDRVLGRRRGVDVQKAGRVDRASPSAYLAKTPRRDAGLDARITMGSTRAGGDRWKRHGATRITASATSLLAGWGPVSGSREKDSLFPTD
jgi:hypothetical protein